MSIVFFQIGQCGNQLGQSLYQALINEAENAHPAHQRAVIESYFHLKGDKLIPNALMIDMEPKVIQSLLSPPSNQHSTQSQQLFSFSPSLSLCREEGSGNNWAYGFNVHGEENLTQVIDMYRKLTEKVDWVEGVIVLQSMAGGTGSGVGSRILQSLRDELGTKPVFSVAVLPRLSGEVILQYYNSVFSLVNLYDVKFAQKDL